MINRYEYKKYLVKSFAIVCNPSHISIFRVKGEEGKKRNHDVFREPQRRALLFFIRKSRDEASNSRADELDIVQSSGNNGEIKGFLDASLHLYKRVCSSVGLSVRM